MFVPLNNSVSECTIMRSRFIAYIFYIDSLEEISDKLDAIKKEHIKAKHILYAYKFNEYTRSNDDNEPGAISKSFLELINNKNINKILIVVVRYFGGTLLGASNLFRTYLNVVTDAIDKLKLGELVDVYIYHLTTDYKTFNKLKNARYRIENVAYFDTIKLDIISRSDILSDLKSFKIDDINVSKDKIII